MFQVMSILPRALPLLLLLLQCPSIPVHTVLLLFLTKLQLILEPRRILLA